ncbi:MAG: hypothetical protein FWG30_09450 [Eubacteriaceae bacterium]|nr:hypothetical protein [Eubacteriaceae bacterium]
MVDIEAITPICAPVAPSSAANIGKIGDFEIVELKIAIAPQQPMINIIRNPAVSFFIIFPK